MKYHLLVIVTLSLILSVACKDNSSGTGNETNKSTISGTLKGPDGSTPIPNATVYVAKGGAVKTLSSQIANTTTSETDCSEPEVNYTAYTCTEADGTFSFEIPVSSGKVTLSITKGVFSFDTTVDVTGDKMELGDVAIPSGEELNTNIAVVTGYYDRMQDILAKFGLAEVGTQPNDFSQYGKLKLGTEKFDLYNGDGSLDSSYPNYEELFNDTDGDGKADLNNYDIIFINCGAEENPVENFGVNTTAARKQNHTSSASRKGIRLLSAQQKQSLRGYVENGGILYVTDLAYDYVEQTFPEFIDYLGSKDTPGGDAEAINAAEQGKGGITVDATILQTNLETWLKTVDCNDGQSCLNDDGTIHVESFLSSWAVMDGAQNGADVKFWIEGRVEWYGDDGSEEDVRPLTTSFDVGNGQVVYSSYHTVEDDYSPYWHPQERVLQYLVLE